VGKAWVIWVGHADCGLRRVRTAAERLKRAEGRKANAITLGPSTITKSVHNTFSNSFSFSFSTLFISLSCLTLSTLSLYSFTTIQPLVGTPTLLPSLPPRLPVPL
jgi:hypothetical protein